MWATLKLNTSMICWIIIGTAYSKLYRLWGKWSDRGNGSAS